jgi:hypothetical protein
MLGWRFSDILSLAHAVKGFKGYICIRGMTPMYDNVKAAYERACVNCTFISRRNCRRILRNQEAESYVALF